MQTMKIKTPHDLGKIRYQEKLIPKDEIKKEFFSNIFVLSFSLFGSLISMGMFIYAYQKTDLWSLIFGVIFLPFFVYLYNSVKSFFRVKLYTVCDNGLAVYEYGFDNKLKNQEFFYFKPHFTYTVEEVKNHHIAGRYKYTYDIFCNFLDNEKVVYTLSCSCVSDENILTKRQKRFFDEALEAFMKYKFKYRDSYVKEQLNV